MEGSLDKCFVREQCSITIQELKTLLNEIIGLQNDLIGLDKDLKVGEPMNVVVVTEGLRRKLSESEEGKSAILKQSVKAAAKMHAEPAKKAVGEWKDIHSRLSAGTRRIS